MPSVTLAFALLTLLKPFAMWTLLCCHLAMKLCGCYLHDIKWKPGYWYQQLKFAYRTVLNRICLCMVHCRSFGLLITVEISNREVIESCCSVLFQTRIFDLEEKLKQEEHQKKLLADKAALLQTEVCSPDHIGYYDSFVDEVFQCFWVMVACSFHFSCG